MASSRKGSTVKSISSSSPTLAFRSSDVAQEINKHKAVYAGTRENDWKHPVGNNAVAMSRNTNLPQTHRGGNLSRSENSSVLSSNRKSKSFEDINSPVGNTNLQAHRGRSSPNLFAKKSVVTRSDAKSEAYRRTENSTSLKNKASKRPPLVKHSPAGTVLSKTDQRVKQLNSKLGCTCGPISPIDSTDVDSGLVTGRVYGQALLPEGFSPEKQMITKWVVASEKSETGPTFKGFQTFDGSKFSPIEEASLVLNESTADLCANVVEKEAETMYEHIDLFERSPIRDTLQSEVAKEHEILEEYVKMDSIFPLHFSPRQYNYPVNVYQNPFQTKIWPAASEESVSDDKCFTCTSEDSTSDGKWSTYSSSDSSSGLQNELSSYLGEKLYSLQHQDCDSISSSEKHYSLQHQDCDSISSSEKHYFLQHQDCDSKSSSILTLDLEELDLGKSSNGMNSDIFESEANKIAHQLVASVSCGFEDFTSDVSLMHCNPSTLVGKHSLKHFDYEEETSLNFSLEKSLTQMGAEFGYLNSKASDEIEDNSNQEPLFWPLNPDSYWHDNNDIKRLQSMMDSECQLKAETASVSSRNTTNSLSSDNSEQQGEMQSFSGRKAASPDVGSMQSCTVRDFDHPSSEGKTSKPRSQLLNDMSRKEFGYQNQSCSQSKLKSAGQSIGEKEFASMGKINDSSRKSSTLPRVNGISREVQAHSQPVGGNKKVSKLDSSALSSKVSNKQKAKHAISPVSSKFSLDNTAKWSDENKCNHFKVIDIKCKQGEKISTSEASIEGRCKESEEVQNDYLTPSADTHKWTSIYENCSTEAGSIEMLDGSKKTKDMQRFKHDLISASCGHAIELKAKGNLSIGLGGSECSLSYIGSTGVGSSECVNPGNERWNLTTVEPFYNIRDLLTGCFESGEDSIEMLVGMKEFDGQEGIGALTSEMIPSPSESGQRETFCSNVDCAIQHGTVQNISTTTNAEGHGESIDFSLIENTVVLAKDTGLDLSLSSETDTAISSDSQPLLPLCPIAQNNQSLASLKESTFARINGNIKYQNSGIGCGKVNSNNGRDKVSLSEWEIKDNKRNVVCESGLTTGSFGHHMSGEEHLYCADISAKDSTACSKTSFMNAVHNWSQTGDEEFSDTFQGFLFNNPIIRSFLSGILDVNHVKLPEENLQGMLQYLRTNADNLIKALLCFLFNNPIIRSCFSGIMDVNCVKFLEEDLQGILQYLMINGSNLIQTSLQKDSQFHLAFGFEGYQDLQKNTEDDAVVDLQSIKYEDCNFIAGERFENMSEPVYFSRNERSKEVNLSGIDNAQNKNEYLQENSGHMLKLKMKGPETEEIGAVNHIHYDDSTVTAERPMSTTILPEAKAKDVLSTLLYFVLQSGKKSIAHDWKSHDINRLVDLEIIGMDRKVQSLEAELMEVKQQNKKLESSLKSMLTVTKRLQQSSQDKRWYRGSRRPLICKFVLHPGKKKVHRCENSRRLLTSRENSSQIRFTRS